MTDQRKNAAGSENNLPYVDDDVEGSSNKPRNSKQPPKTILSRLSVKYSLSVLVCFTLGIGIILFLRPHEDVNARITTLETRTDDRIATLEQTIKELGQKTGPDPRLEVLTHQNQELAAHLEALSENIKTLEGMLGELQSAFEVHTHENGLPAETLQALEERLAGLTAAQQALDQKLIQPVPPQEDANVKLKHAEALNTLLRMQDAVETGRPFQEHLDNLAGIAEIDVPEILIQSAKKGLLPLAQLQKDFPDLARHTLQAEAIAQSGDTVTDRLKALLKSQVSTRSLEPKDGKTLDAKLSRIEAALKTADLQTALKETHALPDTVKHTLAQWHDALTTLVNATEAVQNMQNQLMTLQN